MEDEHIYVVIPIFVLPSLKPTQQKATTHINDIASVWEWITKIYESFMAPFGIVSELGTF
jgi:hypothetical protein